MRAAVLFAVLIGFAAPLHAQTPQATCQSLLSPPNVVVKMHTGPSLRGTLLCVGDEISLAADGRVSPYALRDIARISTPRDPIWDGAAKGAAVGLLLWAACAGECSAEYMVRTTAYYALFGLTLDAVTANSKTLYRAAPRSPAVSWRVRF